MWRANQIFFLKLTQISQVLQITNQHFLYLNA